MLIGGYRDQIDHAIAIYKGRIHDSSAHSPKRPLSWHGYCQFLRRAHLPLFKPVGYLDFTNNKFIHFLDT